MSEDSNYVCTLDKASIKKAKDELNEVPEDRLAAVQALRKWIQEQPHIKHPATDTLTMLMFLRGCKFSQVKAREKIQENLRCRARFPQFMSNVDGNDPVYRTIAESGYMVVLPKRTPQGTIVILQKLGPMKELYEKATLSDIMKFNQLFMFSLFVKNELTQVNGMEFMIDFTGLTPSLLTKMLDKQQGELHKAWQKANVGRLKAFHYYRPGLLFETMMTFYRPFLTKKWIDRIKVHTTMESVYKNIPKECLPAEFLPDDYTGPNAGTMEQITKATIEQLFTKENIEEVKFRTSDAFSIDDSKKPSEQVTGHFRKLNID